MEDSGKKAGNKKLRKKAEELHKKKSPDVHLNLSDVDTLKLIHELEVHQIELEMQYDEIEIAKIAIQVEAEKYRDLYDFAPTGFFTLSNKTIITELNHAGAKMLGKERSHVINKMFGLFVSEKSRPDYNQFIEKIFNSSKKEICEIKLSTNGQSHLILTGFASPTKGHCIVNAVDITEKVVAQQKLKESEELHRITLENINDPVFITKDDGTFTFICPNVEKNLGYTADEIAEMGNISELLGENLFDVNELKPDKDIENIEHKLTNKNGKVHTFLVSVKRVSIKGGTILYVFHNITEKKLAEESLKRSEKRFKDLVKLLPEAVFEIDNNFILSYVNQQAMELFGYSQTDFDTGLNALEMLVPEEREKAKNNFTKRLKGEETGTLEYRALKKDGTVFPILFHATSIIENGKLLGARGVIVDISELKHTEQELVKSEEKFKNIFNNSVVGKSITTLDGKMQVNKAFSQIVGYSEKELNQIKWQEFTHPDDIVKSQEIVNSLISGKIKNAHWEKRYIHKKGHTVWADISTVIQRDKEGQPQFFITSVVNITERIKAEEEQKQMVMMLDVAPSSITVHDFNGKFLYANQKTFDIHGYSRDEFMSLTLNQLDSPESAKHISKRIKTILEKGEASFQVEHITKDGTLVPLEIYTLVTKWGDKQAILSVGTDITERKLAEDSLKEYKELFSLFMQHSPVYTFIKEVSETESRVIQASDNYKDMIGIPGPEMVGKTMEELFPPEFAPKITADDWEVVKKGIVLQLDEELNEKHYTTIKFPLSMGNKKLLAGYTIDITERKNAENVLVKYKEIVSSTTDAIALLDKNYQYIIVNDAYESFSNIKNEQLVGKTVEEYLGTDVFQNEIKANLDKCLTGENVHYQTLMNYPKMGKRFIDVNYFPFREKENEITGVVAVRRDITESKKAEQVKTVLYNISNAVTNTENLKTLIGQIQIELGRIIDITNFHIAFYDKKTDTISLPFFTNTKVDMPLVRKGKTLTRYLVGQKKPLLIDEAKIKELRKNNEIMEFVADPEIWLGVPLMFEGELTGVLAVQSYTNKNAYNESDLRMLEFVSDQISIAIHRKQAEDSLKFEQNRLRTLVDNLPDAIYVKDELGRKVIANLADVENIGAASESDVLGKTDLELFPGEIGQKCYNEDMNVLQTGNPLINKEEYFLKDGVKNWMLTTKIPLFDEQRKIIGLVGIGRNITKQKQAEKDLIEAKEQAEESDRLKSAFLANMSHEIRTPMNGILGFSDLLKTPQLSGEKQHRYIEIIEKSGKRMLNTINNIIDISKIEAGEMQVSLSKFDIRDQVESIVLFFTPEAQRLGIELIVKNNLDKKECFLYSDEEKIYAIFTNLVKNALKYCTDGHIEIGMDKKENEYQFYVKDTGKGIPEERQQAIFERFIQADIEDREAMQGSGLGLAISKSYIEMLGGKIWLKSKEGHGTTFYYTILAKTAPGENKIPKEADTTKESSENIKKLKILIAEDDQVSGMVMEAMVKKYSSTILTATNGEETVRLYKENPDIDLIFMDIRMPILDGYEATRKIREFDTDVIIIAQTAFALSGDRERAIKAGCNDYISKPVNKVELLGLIKKHFKK